MPTSTRRGNGSVAEPVARSPIAPAGPTGTRGAWEVSSAHSKAALRLADMTALSKVLVRGAPGEVAPLLCEHLRARREDGSLIVGTGPDSWLVLAPTGRSDAVSEMIASRLRGCTSLVTVIDVTHGSVVLRLSGESARRALEKVCAIDLSDRATPNGSSFRSRVAAVVSTVVRDDVDGDPSYLIVSDRSSGQFLFDALADAGQEFGIGLTGYPEQEI